LYEILPLCLGTFVLGIDAYIMAGLLPGIGDSFAVPTAIAGQTVSVFTVCYAVSAPIFGALTAGRSVRYVLCTALAIFALANALSGIAGSFSVLLVSRAIAGIGAGLYSPTAFSAAASLVPYRQRGRALGLVVGGLAMGTAVGVPCGLVLAQYLGWRMTLMSITALSVLALVAVALRLPQIFAAAPPSLSQRLSVLADPRVAATIAISFATSVASIGLYTYVAPLLLKLTGSASVLPHLWAWSLGGLVGIYISGRLVDATGRPEWVMVAVLSIMTVVFVVLNWLLPLAALGFCCFGLWGATAWASQGPQQHRLLSLHPDKGGVVVALQSSAHYSGSAAGAALGGLALVGGVRLAQLPYLAAGVAALALICQLWLAIRSKSSSAAPDSEDCHSKAFAAVEGDLS
jgi:predicted MFS family arabinose efflux permease